MKIVLAIGYFDGLHLGHKTLLSSLKALAERNRAIPAVVTFGDDFFPSLSNNTKIIDLENEKIIKLQDFGIKIIDIIKPACRFLEMAGKEFEDYLLGKYQIRGICVGEDFSYGHFAASGIKELGEFCQKEDIQFHVEPFKIINDIKVSSSILRELIIAGKTQEYEKYADSRFMISGNVVHGRGDGRKYGFQTANIAVNPIKIIPKNGVYISETRVEGNSYRSLTHIGDCPTFGREENTIETLLFDFSEVIYNKNIQISFIERIRDNQLFNSPEELRKQIDKDIERINNND